MDTSELRKFFGAGERLVLSADEIIARQQEVAAAPLLFEQSIAASRILEDGLPERPVLAQPSPQPEMPAEASQPALDATAQVSQQPATDLNIIAIRDGIESLFKSGVEPPVIGELDDAA